MEFGGGGGGGVGGSKKDKNKDPEIVAINADISTINVDESISFAAIGGLDGHIRSLKESVFLPLTYPEIFEKLGVKAPGGVLFHGPPGTGKTMMARALANSCSQGERKIHFFMRKGADCLSKYHGEAERQLRLLFDEAAKMQPSIIFFDEIDGLAPVRSSRQDQIHSSIVSTLLALMDGTYSHKYSLQWLTASVIRQHSKERSLYASNKQHIHLQVINNTYIYRGLLSTRTRALTDEKFCQALTNAVWSCASGRQTGPMPWTRRCGARAVSTGSFIFRSRTPPRGLRSSRSILRTGSRRFRPSLLTVWPMRVWASVGLT